MTDFASDNHAGVHPELLEAIATANAGHSGSYGHDEWTEGAEAAFREHFGADARAFPVFNGTGANVASMDALTAPYEAAICTDVAHMHVDECGAPERLAQTKLLLVEHTDGKLTADDIARWEPKRGDEHHVQPRVVSITQATELGTVYSLEETRAIADAAHQLGMHLHIDGARLANAAAALGVSLRELTTDAGVDIVSFGATKNGAPRRRRGRDPQPRARPRLPLHPQAARPARLEDALHLRAAHRAPRRRPLAAKRRPRERDGRSLATAVTDIPAVEIVYPVEANAVFARLPREAIDDLLANLEAEHPFYIWDEAENVVRWMCAWDTTAEDVEHFAGAVAEATRTTA